MTQARRSSERVATLSTAGGGLVRARRCSPPARTCGGCASTACELDGIHYLRALGNADAIRADADDAEHVVLIGGSYIASEVAASLTLPAARSCAIVMQEDVTLERVVRQRRSARFFQDVLEEHGVEVHGGDELERFEGDGRPRHARWSRKSGLRARLPTRS